MESASPRRQDFEPDGVPAPPSDTADAVQGQLPTTALARFEFESGRGNEGTKILMVEWEDDSQTQNVGDWEVSWEGKSTLLSARDGAEEKLHRLYFLLPPGTSIPRVVTLAQQGGKIIHTTPLPAIFPAELGLTARTAGKKGVLHTIWAKKRLSVLQQEIDAEMKVNGEGIGLEMALQEKQWIEEHFGIGAKVTPEPQHSMSPVSPKTQSSGRLTERLKGLKLGTSASELAKSSSDQENEPNFRDSHPLSPDMGDVAVSSFSLFHSAAAPRASVKAVAQDPPDYILGRQAESLVPGRIGSLDEVASGNIAPRVDDETEDELFAVRLSPRSPDMAKSPFSFTAKDTAPWLKGGR
ncbi:hypothetical protein F5884DRAFT_367888 [Xylogone sp. PMI_703]|nr:hypothetical protein F5884DRAFT_367888 [Xylogone sp. PMI_703]